MSMLTEVMRQAIAAGASDIHIKRDQPPLFRIDKKLAPGPFEPIAVEQIRAQVAPVVSLYVNAFNHSARRVYEKVGFIQEATYATVLF